MSIRARIEDCMVLLAAERPHGALLSLLVAAAATSRRRYPDPTPSRRKPGKAMRDGEAFETFLHDEMPKICRVQNYNIRFRGVSHRLEHVLYKWLRCELVHAATLLTDVRIIPDPEPGTTRLGIDATGISLSVGWFHAISNAIIAASENSDQFGQPPLPPYPIDIPMFQVKIGPAPDTVPTLP